MTINEKHDAPIPFAGILVALGFGALLLWPAVVLGDSLSRGSPPAQYRGPSGDVQGRGVPLFEGSASPEPVRSTEGWNRWEFWFEYEKDALLRGAMARPGPSGPGNEGTTVAGPTAADLRDRVLPALRSALRDPSLEVRSSAILALGDAGDAASLPALADLLRTGGPVERRAAALALGFVGGPSAVPPLARAVDQDPDPSIRAMASVGLGLTGDPAAAPVLRSVLARSMETSGRDAREIRTAALSGLGLLRDRSSVQLLQKVLGGAVRDDRVRAHAATALGRIGDPAAIPPLLAALADDSDAAVRRSAALALGAFEDPAAAAGLLRALEGDGDGLVRGYSAVAYARSAGKGAAARLIPFTAIRNDRGMRGFAAVALGLTGNGGLAAPVLDALVASRSEDSLRSAAAIGLGLLGDRAACAPLLALSKDPSGSPELRGYALLGAALTGDPAAAGAARDALTAKAPAAFRRSAALAGGVRPLPSTPGLLLRTLLDERDPTVRGAALLGLGLSPDRGVIPHLVDMAAGDSGNGSLEQSEAVQALGQISLRGSLPPSARIGADLDTRSLTAVLDMATRVF